MPDFHRYNRLTMRSLRLRDEGDAEFRDRAERAGCYARLLVDAALANLDIQRFIANPDLPYTVESERRSPTVRIDYDEAFAVCGIGEGLQATKSKHWGEGPQILPLEPDDPVDPVRILYVFKEGSLYNRRFMQRRRMKELLGRRYRKLVQTARGFTLAVFLENLAADQAYAIRRILQMEPRTFWRACKGNLIELPDTAGSLDPDVIAGLSENRKQLLLNLDHPKKREGFDRSRT